MLPPTSSSVIRHIKRAHYVIRQVFTLLEPIEVIGDPAEHGWVWDSGMLLPDLSYQVRLLLPENATVDALQRVVHVKRFNNLAQSTVIRRHK